MPNEVVAVTRNGRGVLWRLPSRQAARLSPLVQLGDVVLSSATEVLAWCVGWADEVAEHLPAGRTRDDLLDALRRLAEQESPARRREAQEVATRVWEQLLRGAREPPTDPQALLDLIVEDRRAAEGVVLRLRPERGQKEAELADEKTEKTNTTKKRTRAPRLPETSTIRLGEAKPGRDGMTSDRVAKYKNGMTVKQANEAGIPDTAIRYDAERSFIVVSPAIEGLVVQPIKAKVPPAEKTGSAEKKAA